jgi:hypothetical protein
VYRIDTTAHLGWATLTEWTLVDSKVIFWRYFEAVTVSDRAKLYRRAAFTITLLSIVAGCARGMAPTAIYDRETRRLIRLESDLDSDGRIDQRTYMNGNVPLRAEADLDGDGRIDRWEYFDASALLRTVGTSSAGDGIEDTWTWAVTADGVRRVDRSRRRDRYVDRTEYYRGDSIERAEDDTDGNGLVDKWEAFEAGRLRQVAFDMNHDGRAERRLVYLDSQRVTVEADEDGDGQWQAVFSDIAQTPPSQSRSDDEKPRHR